MSSNRTFVRFALITAFAPVLAIVLGYAWFYFSLLYTAKETDPVAINNGYHSLAGVAAIGFFAMSLLTLSAALLLGTALHRKRLFDRGRIVVLYALLFGTILGYLPSFLQGRLPSFSSTTGYLVAPGIVYAFIMAALYWALVLKPGSAATATQPAIDKEKRRLRMNSRVVVFITLYFWAPVVAASIFFLSYSAVFLRLGADHPYANALLWSGAYVHTSWFLLMPIMSAVGFALYRSGELQTPRQLFTFALICSLVTATLLPLLSGRGLLLMLSDDVLWGWEILSMLAMCMAYSFLIALLFWEFLLKPKEIAATPAA